MVINKNPPLSQHYRELMRCTADHPERKWSPHQIPAFIEDGQPPLIDLNYLKSSNHRERQDCVAAICGASSEWGFFQVANHGISTELLTKMKREQVKLFETPFEIKASCSLLNNSYRWGTPTATNPSQFSWSEAFNVPLAKVSKAARHGKLSSLREVMNELAAAMSKLAMLLAGVLAENLGHRSDEFVDICDESTCFMRLNHYPVCPISPEIFGLVPHTDSDFLTILYPDQVSGLQLMKDSKWVAVKPIQDALLINIGDLFQAWSNDIYKSVMHKVVANEKMERYSVAYFLCPSNDSIIGSSRENSIYRKFTFGEYRSQVQEDVKRFGQKIGLSRFLL